MANETSTAEVLCLPAMTPKEALSKLEGIDLSMVRMKLADTDEGPGWADAKTHAVEREYRRFLALHLLYPGAAIVPCGVVDEMWHAHILDTQAYEADTRKSFGFFLHHFPYFGLRGEQDARDLAVAYEQTLDLYEQSFGEPLSGTWVDASGRTCRTKCKPMKCK